jgi:hypothetical protein
MTEPNEIEFHEHVKRRGRSSLALAGILGAVAVLLVGGAVAVMGASPSPSVGADPSAAASPAASGDPGTASPKRDRLGWKAFGPGGIGRGGFNSIAITAIDGNSVSLKTDDGWTRTITLTDTTTITKAGSTITAGDLAVGDEVRIGQDRADDGTYTVTRVAVVLPTVVGEVTAVNGSTITITQRGGTTATIHVDADTTFRVDGAAGTLSDVKVGSIVIAEGTQRADGSLDATRVGTGFERGPGKVRDRLNGKDGAASPAPSSSPS